MLFSVDIHFDQVMYMLHKENIFLVQFSLVYFFVGSEPGDRCSSQWIFILTQEMYMLHKENISQLQLNKHYWYRLHSFMYLYLLSE